MGGAQRPDSFERLDPAFRERLWQLVQSAPPELGLTITSAYRSPELQAQLWEGALAKYGDPEIADNWVARPGQSFHNRGMAADFAVNGSLIRDANSAAAQWLAQNAARYGLAVPLANEPWQVELAGARGGQAPAPQSGPQNALAGQMGQDTGQNALAAPLPRPRATNALIDPQMFMARQIQYSNPFEVPYANG